MATTVETLQFKMTGDATRYEKMLTDCVKMTSSAMRTIGSAVRTAGAVATATLTAPFVAAGAAASKMYSEFDQGMTETFAKLGRVSPEVRNQMEDVAKALSMSGEVRYSPAQLAKGYEELASAGLDAARSMAALPSVAKLAQAGAMDLGTAVKQATGAMASFGAMTRDPARFTANLQRFSDVITGVANETTTGVEQVARAMAADAAVAAKQYGMTIEELGAILGVYAQQNKEAEEAGNLTGRALRLMTSSYVDNKATWNAMGIVIDDAQGNFIKFADAIGQLEKALVGLSGTDTVRALDRLGFETLSQKSILPLIGQSEELKRQEKLYARVGTTVDMASIQMESFSAQLAVVKNALTVAGIEVGQVLAPALLKVAAVARQVIDVWHGLDSSTKSLLVGLGAVAAAVGPVLLAIGFVGPALSAGLAAVGSALAPLAPALLAAGAALAGFVTYAGGIQEAWDMARDGAGRAWNWITERIATFREWFTPIAQAIGSIGKAAWEVVVNAVCWAVDTATSLFISFRDIVLAAWSTISGGAVVNWTTVRDAVRDTILFAEFTVRNFGDVAGYVWAEAKLGFVRMANVISFFFTDTLPYSLRWFSRNWRAVLSNAWDWVVAVFTNVGRYVVETFQAIDWSGLWGKFKTTAREAAEWTLEKMRTVFVDNIDPLLKGALNFAGLWAPEAEREAKAATKAVSSALKDLPKDVGLEAFVAPVRQEGEWEKRLREERDRLESALDKSWKDFRLMKLQEFAQVPNLPPVVTPPALDDAGKQGQAYGKALTDPIKAAMKEVGKLSAVSFFSAESLSTIAEYRDMLRGTPKLATGRVKQTVDVRPAGDGSRPNKSEDYLKELVDQGREQAKRNPLKVEFLGL